VGAAYTSVSFLQTLHPFIKAHRRWFIISFIFLSTVAFTIIGNPVTVMVKAGAVNGIILPLSLSVILIASAKKNLVHSYTHPAWLQICGWLVVAALVYITVKLF
jgi:Mn2+/Fe2+ NRAMP family transporter